MVLEIDRAAIATIIPNNIRLDNLAEDDGIALLAESLKEKGQTDPIHITKSGKIVKGHRRVAAARLAGLTHLDAIVVEEDEPEQILEEQLIEVCHSKSIPEYDRAVALRDLMERKGLTKTALAARLKIGLWTVTKSLSLFDCPDFVIELARQGKIGLARWYDISKDPTKAAALDPSATPAEKKARRDKYKLPLPSGTLTVELEEPGLKSLIRILREALDEAVGKEAEGESIETLASSLDDRSKTGFMKPTRRAGRPRKAVADDAAPH